jgi:hypothetical protein
MVQDTETEARERALARIRKYGKKVHTVEELYGPSPGPERSEDVDALLEFLDEQRQPVCTPDTAEAA